MSEFLENENGTEAWSQLQVTFIHINDTTCKGGKVGYVLYHHVCRLWVKETSLKGISPLIQPSTHEHGNAIPGNTSSAGIDTGRCHVAVTDDTGDAVLPCIDLQDPTGIRVNMDVLLLCKQE